MCTAHLNSDSPHFKCLSAILENTDLNLFFKKINFIYLFLAVLGL